MNEADVRLKVNHALRALGYWPITQTDAVKCSKCGNLFYPEKGRPDLLCPHPTAIGIVVEVKTLRPGETSFSFSEIDESQRKWLDRWLDDGGRGYIALGVIRQHGKVQKLDHLYLVDWKAWIRTEGLISPTQASIPFDTDRCRSKLLREKNWTIFHLLSPWEMFYEGGLWRLYESHSAHILGGPNDTRTDDVVAAGAL